MHSVKKSLKEHLFVYGTLREPQVQKKEIGRIVNGTPNILDGYKKSTVTINGKTYPIIEPLKNSSIEGLVLEISPEELRLLDIYETDAYKRGEVLLRSGKKAWVYKK